ncbi:thiamine pyrophosphate-dependent dehydrogenase E1 component subunit alpha [Kitasatospora sp. RB6PN24]|uniref:thiamine pyrophosphate-dependent dehydrogenase E1 component subunit alpha n=1 Tax=Kitasatospora humi TaxID=2893891 RepID=UPI001E31F745|nr:thiamine pyrophosphate-dependent dehydrogenase E1 component subunit alpha [Kitasatospora humi]MCC9306063.1 thiamine pyrophosphate-dependent dehydrogenase E1 component subunit alpha [Kitasatospora humi]
MTQTLQERRSPLPSSPDIDLFELYRRMRVLRRMDEVLAELVAERLITGPMHLGIGQEAAGIGATAALRPGDMVTATHRPHAQYVGLGLPLGRTFAEMMGRVDGQCGGRGGHMLIADAEHGLLAPSGIVGHSLLFAVGHGLAQKRAGQGAVTLCVTGDGAVNSGAFNESLNMAALWRLPVVVLVENNGYGLSVRLDRHSHQTELYRRAAGYGIPGEVVDGNDVEAVHQAVSAAVARARDGQGPVLVEALTFRNNGFSSSDRGGYRDPDEGAGVTDPLELAARRLRERGASVEELAEIDRLAAVEIDEAVAFAKASPWPDTEALFEYAAKWDEGARR